MGKGGMKQSLRKKNDDHDDHETTHLQQWVEMLCKPKSKKPDPEDENDMDEEEEEDDDEEEDEDYVEEETMSSSEEWTSLEDDDGEEEKSDDDDEEEEHDKKSQKKKSSHSKSHSTKKKKKKSLSSKTKKHPTKRRRRQERDEETESSEVETESNLSSSVDSFSSEDADKEEPRRKRKQHANKKSKKSCSSSSQKKRKRTKKEEEDTEEEEDMDTDEEEDDEEDEEEEENEESTHGQDAFTAILTTLGLEENGEDTETRKIRRLLHPKHDVIYPSDEQTFMRDTYTEIPEPLLESTHDRLTKSISSKSSFRSMSSKKSNQEDTHGVKKEDDKDKETTSNKSPNNAMEAMQQVEDEYLDLIELKKHIAEKLTTKPKSTLLQQSFQDCKQAIGKLIKTNRLKNTKAYYKLLKSQILSEGEIEYFKQKLSHREQCHVIQEMRDIQHHLHIEKPYRLALMQSKMPVKYKATVLNKLNTMYAMDPGDTEYFKIKNWVDTFMRIPFDTYRNLPVTLQDGVEKCSEYMKQAKNILDSCVYGLEDAKLQTMQMVGQWISNPSAIGTAIAIHGSPGTGKTQLVRDGISKILGREFAFVPLGGAGDASYLEGHSYTYEGSMWGKIIQILIDCKSMNPIIFFDELDKVSDSPRGQEIINILVHLTDQTQNSQYHDKYFSEVDFDLSKCLFIFSYNDEGNINPILKDRMYRIQTKPYVARDKLVIAQKYILPKIREQVNFQEDQVIFPDDVLLYLATETRFTQGEQGVRNLKRCLEIIYSKLNLCRLVNTTEDIQSILGDTSVDLQVTFPYTVTRKAVNVLIKKDESQNASLLAMYV